MNTVFPKMKLIKQINRKYQIINNFWQKLMLKKMELKKIPFNMKGEISFKIFILKQIKKHQTVTT